MARVQAGIVTYGTYVPYHRLARSTIGRGLGTPVGSGARTVASFDEDTTSMGVEAARVAVSNAPTGWSPDAVAFVTTRPAYLDKTNATTIHAALDLDPSVMAVDVVGSSRNGSTALRLAAESSGRRLVVSSDMRYGLPGSVDEREGGDAAAAVGFGPADGDDVIARVIGVGAATREVLERWRVPEQPLSQLWEERFGEHAYGPAVDAATADALKDAGLVADAIDHAIVVGPHARAVRSARKGIGVSRDAIAGDLAETVGNTGAAHVGLALANVLDDADPDQVIAVVSVADGADVLLLRATEQLPRFREGRRTAFAAQVAAGNDGLAYNTYLTWRGLLDRQPPRRPDPRRPAPPPSLRATDWKFAFVGSRCEECDTRHLPPQRVCAKCGAVDAMSDERMAQVPARVTTFTIDRLTYSMNPPVVAAVLDFDGGGRFKCELTDVDPDEVAIGDRVEMTFRRLHTADGVHNYFWKARPVRAASGTGETSDDTSA